MIRLGAIVLAAGLAFAPATAAQEREVWFDDLQDGPPPGETDQAAMAGRVAAAVFHPGDAVEPLPEPVRADIAPRIIFFSTSDGMSRCRVFREGGRGWAEALERGIARVRKAAEAGAPPQWLKFDLVCGSAPIADAGLGRALPIERSLEGIAFDRASGFAFLPEESLARGLVDPGKKLIKDALAKAAGNNDERQRELARVLAASPIPLRRFTTAATFINAREAVPLYRGHRRYASVRPEDLLEACRAGIRYLARSVTPDGRFDYLYRAQFDSSYKGYNVVRHAGTIMAMAEWIEVAGDRTFQPEMLRAVKHLQGAIRPMPADSADAAGVVEDDCVRIGANALAAVAFAKIVTVTGDRALVPDMLRLGRWLQAMEKPDGDFPIHTAKYPGGEDLGQPSEYYPGEAVLAMVRIHPLDPGGDWLDSAEKGARRLIEVRDAGKFLDDLYHDHWLLYALNDLYRLRPERMYLEHAMKMSRAIILKQHRTPPWPDWVGGYYEPPYSTPVATRSEGLNAAFRLARDFATPAESAAIREAIELGVRFELQTQYRPEQAMYLANPQRVLGGFHGNLEDPEIRIDYVQHNVSAMLRLYEILNGK